MRPTTTSRSAARLFGILAITAAVVAHLGFLLLGSRFEYPDILQHPAAEILARFHADAAAIASLFLLLAVGAALIAPISVLLVRSGLVSGSSRLRRGVLLTGVAAAVVQVIGLLRWPLLVPRFASIVADPSAPAAVKAEATATFLSLHHFLGGFVGETLGYTFTAAWTGLVVVGLVAVRRRARWFAPLGAVSAVLIGSGVLIPLRVPGTDFANFVGYVVWSVWIVALGVSVLRHEGAASARDLDGALHGAVDLAVVAEGAGLGELHA